MSSSTSSRGRVREGLLYRSEAIDESFGLTDSYLKNEVGLDPARLRALHDRLVTPQAPLRDQNTANKR